MRDAFQRNSNLAYAWLRRLLGAQLGQNMVTNGAAVVFGAVTGIVVQPVYLKVLNYDAYGTWLVLAAFLNISQIGTVGISPALARLVAAEHGKGNPDGASMYLQDALLMLVAVTGVVALALLYWQHGILNALRLTGAAAQMAGALFPYIVVLSAFVYVGDALSAAVVGFGRTDLVSRAHVAARVAAIAVTFALLYRKVGVPSLLIGLAIQYAIPGAFCSLWLLRFLGRDRALIWRGSLSSSKVLLRLGVGLATYSTVPILIHPLNKLVLGRICGVSTVPIYEVSYTAVVTLKALIEGTLKPLIPEISRLSGSSPWNSEPALRRLRTRTIAFLLALVAPGCAIVFFLAPFLLQIWLRSRFTPAMVPTFRILLVGFGLGFAALPRIQELIGLGDVRQLVIASGIQLVANIGLLVLLNSVATITLTRLAVAAATGPAVAALFLLLAGNLAKGRHGGAANAPYTVRTEMSLAETGE